MTPKNIELDHVFLFVESRTVAEKMMDEAGLRANYSRSHPGQGTTNLCACLDDVFLELLWLDGSVMSEESERVSLGKRGRGEGMPVGIAWRGDCPLKTDQYAAPFMPIGKGIPFARASNSLSVPFVFETPGGVPPILREDDLAGERQRPLYTTLLSCLVRLQEPEPA
ncbi:MAG: VOC family protein, partial [Pseudomonadota bacterium]